MMMIDELFVLKYPSRTPAPKVAKDVHVWCDETDMTCMCCRVTAAALYVLILFPE